MIWNVIALVAGTLIVVISLTIAVRIITKVLGETMERLIQTATMGQSPAGSDITAFAKPIPGATTEVPSKGTSVMTEPPLPPLEATTLRLRDDLRRQYREQGRPVTEEEAEIQARIMMAESGLML